MTICDSAWVSPLASKVCMSNPNSAPYFRNCLAAKAWDSLAMLETTNSAFGLSWALAPTATAASTAIITTFNLDIQHLLCGIALTRGRKNPVQLRVGSSLCDAAPFLLFNGFDFLICNGFPAT